MAERKSPLGLFPRKVTVIAGAFGSGKTEVALNCAFALKRAGEEVAVVDLDIINPYFRSREAAKWLKEQGIGIAGGAGEAGYADIPALSPSIVGALEKPGLKVIVDVGGDGEGARVLRRFAHHLPPGEAELLVVVNPYRPHSRTEAEVTELVGVLERESGLKAAALVANPHLGRETSPEEFWYGYRLVQDFSQKLQIPIRFVSIEVNLYARLPACRISEDLFPINRYMRLPWEVEI